MIFTARCVALAALASALASALPLDVAPRAKSYSVINVDGGSPTQAPTSKKTTVVEEKTKTVEVVNPGPTVTTTMVKPAPVTTTTSLSSSSRKKPTTSPTTTTSTKPKTSVITVTVTPSPSSTEYYDDGMWHTRYPIKGAVPAGAAITEAPRAAAAA